MGLSLIRFLIRNSKDLSFSKAKIGLVFATGILGGLASIALITLINRVLVRGKSKSDFLAFGVLCLLLPLSRLASEALLIRLSQTTSLEIRMLLSQRIVAAPLRTLEEIGTPRLMAVLAEDIVTITNVLTSLPATCMNLVIVVGCLCYIGWVSPGGFGVVLAFLACGMAIYRLLMVAGVRLLRRARRDQDALFGHFRGLTHGAKELKLSSARREAFLGQHLRPTAQSLSENNRAGLTAFTAAAAWGQALLFILITLLVLEGPSWGFLEEGQVVVFVLTTLYMMAPLTGLLAVLPSLSRANIAVQQVEALSHRLSPRAEAVAHPPPSPLPEGGSSSSSGCATSTGASATTAPSCSGRSASPSIPAKWCS